MYNSLNVSTYRNLAIPFPPQELSISVCYIFGASSKSGLDSHVNLYPAALQGNTIWAAGMLSTFSCDVRATVGGINARLNWSPAADEQNDKKTWLLHPFNTKSLKTQVIFLEQ